MSNNKFKKQKFMVIAFYFFTVLFNLFGLYNVSLKVSCDLFGWVYMTFTLLYLVEFILFIVFSYRQHRKTQRHDTIKKLVSISLDVAIVTVMVAISLWILVFNLFWGMGCKL
jgi:hypothetical protein